jgi:hypothetical protein
MVDCHVIHSLFQASALSTGQSECDSALYRRAMQIQGAIQLLQAQHSEIMSLLHSNSMQRIPLFTDQDTVERNLALSCIPHALQLPSINAMPIEHGPTWLQSTNLIEEYNKLCARNTVMVAKTEADNRPSTHGHGNFCGRDIDSLPSGSGRSRSASRTRSPGNSDDASDIQRNPESSGACFPRGQPVRGPGKAVLDATVSSFIRFRFSILISQRAHNQDPHGKLNIISCSPGGPRHLPRATARRRSARGPGAGAERRAGGAARGHAQDDTRRVEPEVRPS